MNYIILYGVTLVSLFLWLYLEARRHQHNLDKLSLRIHVNGTRGKSSVTRLIAAGLRAGGHKVFAKTTGTEAKMIFPDGSEQEILRRGPANIRENIMVVRKAVENGADAVVIECMAINPELQKFCEQRLVRSHIGVITNIRADHEDVMGSGIDCIAASLSCTIPEEGILVTTDEAEKLLKKINSNASMIAVAGQAIDDHFLRGFPYEVIPDNVAIALKVCELAGVDAHTAIVGMRRANPDVGNLQINQLTLAGRPVNIINALAANDPESTLWLWKKYITAAHTVVVLLNCRKDRKFRTVQLCEAITKVHNGYFIVVGDAAFGRAVLMKQGIAPEKIFALTSPLCFNEFIDSIQILSADPVTVFAAGNVKGLSKEFMTKLSGG